MSDQEKKQKSFQILSDRSMKDRKSLLLISTIILIMKFANLTPTKISALGITISDTDKIVIFISLGIILGYFFVSFLLNSVGEVLSFNIGEKLNLIERELDKVREYIPGPARPSHARAFKIEKNNKKKYDELQDSKINTNISFISISKRIIFTNKIFEFYFPIIWGVFAFGVLIFYKSTPVENIINWLV